MKSNLGLTIPLVLSMGIIILVTIGLRDQARGEPEACDTTPYEGALPTYAAAPLIGRPGTHRVAAGESFYEIARHYDLGVNELIELYPAFDPWIPPPGSVVTIPTHWIVPAGDWRGIVVNIAELRLYYFLDDSRICTFPIGIGRRERVTPVGRYRARNKRECPTWHVPPSLRADYPGIRQIPPGPDNPLGNYWIGLGHSSYGIHGTNIPAAVGRMVTHGCIRTYPEDMRMLFPHVPTGTPICVIYRPVKVARYRGAVFLEVHRDIYGKVADLQAHCLQLLDDRGLMDAIDIDKVHEALRARQGMPIEVTAAKARAEAPDTSAGPAGPVDVSGAPLRARQRWFAREVRDSGTHAHHGHVSRVSKCWGEAPPRSIEATATPHVDSHDISHAESSVQFW